MKDPTRNMWRALPKPRFLPQWVVHRPKTDVHAAPRGLSAPKFACTPSMMQLLFLSHQPYRRMLFGVVWILSILRPVWYWQPPRKKILPSRMENPKWQKRQKGLSWSQSKKEKVKQSTIPKSRHYFNIWLFLSFPIITINSLKEHEYYIPCKEMSFTCELSWVFIQLK